MLVGPKALLPFLETLPSPLVSIFIMNWKASLICDELVQSGLVPLELLKRPLLCSKFKNLLTRRMPPPPICTWFPRSWAETFLEGEQGTRRLISDSRDSCEFSVSRIRFYIAGSEDFNWPTVLDLCMSSTFLLSDEVIPSSLLSAHCLWELAFSESQPSSNRKDNSLAWAELNLQSSRTAPWERLRELLLESSYLTFITSLHGRFNVYSLSSWRDSGLNWIAWCTSYFDSSCLLSSSSEKVPVINSLILFSELWLSASLGWCRSQPKVHCIVEDSV